MFVDRNDGLSTESDPTFDSYTENFVRLHGRFVYQTSLCSTLSVLFLPQQFKESLFMFFKSLYALKDP